MTDTTNPDQVVDTMVTDNQDQPITTPEVKAPEVPEGGLDLNQEAFKPVEDTGIKAFDTVGKLLNDNKVTGAKSIMAELQETGELSLTSKATLVESLGENVAALVIDQLDGYVSTVKEAADKETNRVMVYAAEAFGDTAESAAEAWPLIQAFAQSPESGLTADDRKAMSKMLKAGGLQAEMVIDRLATLYNSNAGDEQEADIIQGDTRPNSGFTALSASEYIKQVKVAIAQHGEQSPEVDRIRAQRMKSIQLGK